MPPARRRLLAALGLVILALSLCLLFSALRPLERQSDRQPIPAQDLILPAPQDFALEFWL